MEWVNIKDRWYELAPRPAPVPKSALALAAAAVRIIVITCKKGERITRDPFEED